MKSAIGIVHTSFIVAAGLRQVLQPLFEQTEILIYNYLTELQNDIERNDGNRPYFVHFFVDEHILMTQADYFLNLPQLTIALSSNASITGSPFPVFNIQLPEEQIYRQILRMHRLTGVATAPPADNTLSQRETQVLCLIAKGLPNKLIADQLSISIPTVVSHRQNITRKLGIHSIAALTVYAIMKGYIDHTDIVDLK
ncbi:MAG: response regulator transcription factor [Paludibacteraceae bacterium]|nr:response regulator transcription factor [Paludibacteraceae bacterium]